MPKTPYFYFIKQISRVRNNHPRALSQTKNCFSAIPQAPLRTEYRSPHSKKASLFFIKILCIPRLLSLFCQNSLRLALKKTLLLFHQNSLRPALALPFCQNSLRPALKEGSLLFRQNSLRPAPSDGARRPCLLGRAGTPTGILRRGCFIKNFPFP